MKISGFTFLRNGIKLYYPFKESIESILPIVDEYVVALGPSDENDHTLDMLQSIQSDKIKIIHTTWDLEKYPNSTIYAQQTDLAKVHCIGDWLLYLQGDEVIHEKDHNHIVLSCYKELKNTRTEGFVFNYLHFYGDYNHIIRNHAWYEKEVRLIRNSNEIHSWRDGQSFRYYSAFNENYLEVKESRPLRVKQLHASVYHYGWVRPPQILKVKNDATRKYFNHTLWKEYSSLFDFGRMDQYYIFDGSHPKVMKEKIDSLYWQDFLRIHGPLVLNREKMKHERWKYRILSFIEQKLLNGKKIGGFKNYTLLKE